MAMSLISQRLGSWSRPPSISPVTFSSFLPERGRFDEEVLPKRDVKTEDCPSPVQYLKVMTRLAYIFYVHIKSSNHHTAINLSKALEEVGTIRNSLPVHLTPQANTNLGGTQTEQEHPWISLQRHILCHVMDFIQLSISRVLSMRNNSDDTLAYRAIAVASARRILQNYLQPSPRIYRLIWVVSASTVAAGVYLIIDHLVTHQDASNSLNNAQDILLVREASSILRNHCKFTVHAAKGSAVIERLLHLYEQKHSSPVARVFSFDEILHHLSLSTPERQAQDRGPDVFGASIVEDTLGVESFLNNWCGDMGDAFEAMEESMSTMFDNGDAWQGKDEDNWPVF